MVNPFKPRPVDPNKVKKCNCEDKYGPKPFDDSMNQKNVNKTKR